MNKIQQQTILYGSKAFGETLPVNNKNNYRYNNFSPSPSGNAKAFSLTTNLNSRKPSEFTNTEL
jgi:hypothetical protein